MSGTISSVEILTNWMIFLPDEHLVSVILNPIPQSARNHCGPKFLVGSHKRAEHADETIHEHFMIIS